MIANVQEPLIVIGGAGFLGSAVVERCRARGREVVAVDRYANLCAPVGGVTPVQADLLTDPLLEVFGELPQGPIALLAGNSDPRAVRSWQLVLDNALTTARLLRCSPSAASFWCRPSRFTAPHRAPDARYRSPPPLDDDALRAWNPDAMGIAAQPCPPWRAEAALPPTGRQRPQRPVGLRHGQARARTSCCRHRARSTSLRSSERPTCSVRAGPRRGKARPPGHGRPLTAVVDVRRTFLAVKDLADAHRPPMRSAGIFQRWCGLPFLDLIEVARASPGRTGGYSPQ